MIRRSAALALIGAVTLAGCSALDPYATVPPPLPPGAATVPRVAICYNKLKTLLPEVQKEAQQECAADTVAEPAGTDWYLQDCPLLLPARATFVCRARKTPGR